MRKNLLLIFCISFSSSYADDYSFDFAELEEIEVKSYEYNGYLKAQQKHQVLNKSSSKFNTKNKNSMDTYLGEAFINFKYYKNDYTFTTDFVANYKNIDKVEEDVYTLNQAFLSYKYDNNHLLTLGKKTSKWGKGYFFNPIAFIDRKKDPNNPEESREGYTQLNYNYNKVFNSDIENISFDTAYIKTSSSMNDDLYEEDSNIIALKLYMLYKDIDIDLAYFYSDKQANKIGIDFSTNIETNFEIHGEYSRSDDGYYATLLGLKYLTNYELTITSEYYYQNEIQEKTTPFWDNKYLLNKFSQKEPFDILYYSVYYKNSLNLNDNSHQNNLGIIYTGIKNLDIDFSIGKYFGDSNSEFGSKLIDKFTWAQIKYSF